MDEASQPLSSAGGNSARHNYRQGPGGMPGGVNGPFNIQNEISFIKEDAIRVHNAVLLLEAEKESLRKAIRKLKMENVRIKQKVKRLVETVADLTGTSKENGVNGVSEADLDYDDIGRDFILVGGVHDPLSLRHEVSIRDKEGIEHKSAERYYWYKMAEYFNDTDAMQKIQQASNVNTAEAAMKEIKNFDEESWNKLKLKYWEEGQLFKLQHVRSIGNLLVYSKTTYIAVASQDKCFGTGWRKNRQESNKPIFWDGQNEGGKILMKIRQQLKENHSWTGPHEEEEIQKKFKELQRFVWRRIDPTKRQNVAAPGRVPVGPRRTNFMNQRRGPNGSSK